MIAWTSRQNNGALVAGLCLVFFGGVFILHNIGFIQIGSLWTYWPLLVMGAGVWGFIQSRGRKGLWLMLIGVWLLISARRLFGLSFGNSWPLLIAATGIVMIWDDLSGNHRWDEEDDHGN